jgi:hypothetical protein
MHGYVNGILAGLTSCVVIQTTGSINLVETTCITNYFLFLL